MSESSESKSESKNEEWLMKQSRILAVLALAGLAIPMGGEVRLSAQPSQAQAPAFPQGAKMAFVNVLRIARESTDGQTAAKRIKTVSDQRITQLNDRLKGLQDQLQQLQQSTAPATDPARDQLRSQIEQGQIELERARFEAQVELQTLEQELLTDFSRRLGPIIERVADERQLHLVLPIRSGFLWAHPGLDLTDEVMRRFNTGQ
jgi:Skp family chaperone for outer membrane proteins